MNYLVPIIALSAGLIMGGLAAWIFSRAKIAGAVAETKAELQPQIAALNERVSAKELQIVDLQGALAGAQKEKTQTASQLQQEGNARISAEGRVKVLDQQLATERQQIETLEQKFQKEFEAVADRLLRQNAGWFNQQSGENLEKLLTPLKENLVEFRTRLEASQKETSNYATVLQAEIGRIGSEATNLSKALKGDAKVLGNWGENRLDQILEKSGLQKDIHYRRQMPMTNEDGDRFYPDVVVQLPDNKNLVIDSKVSLSNYAAHVNATDEDPRRQFLENLCVDVRRHFTELGAKRYQDLYSINAPDFVLMYIPIEPAYFAVLSHEPELFAEALEKNVVFITNSTLLATLRTVASVWRLADQQKNALEIARRGGELHDKFVGVIESLGFLGGSLRSANEHYETTMKRLHDGRGNLIWQIDQLKKMGAKASSAVPTKLLEKAVTSNEVVEADAPAVSDVPEETLAPVASLKTLAL